MILFVLLNIFVCGDFYFERLKEGDKAVFFVKDSFEIPILLEMQNEPRWQGRLAFQVYDDCKGALEAHGWKITHGGVHRQILFPDTLETWVRDVLAPRLELYGFDAVEFQKEFLQRYGKDYAVQKEAVLLVE
jgi:hypothetical protein